MANWKKTIKIKQYFTEKEDWKSIQHSMNMIADELQNHFPFNEYTDFIDEMRCIPENAICGMQPVDFANNLISKIYDIADSERIWIE